jgi:hypothetical protein
MLKALILICAVATSPDQCDMAHARDVLQTPVQSAMPMVCLREGQAYAASVDYPFRDDEYPMVVCHRMLPPANVG